VFFKQIKQTLQLSDFLGNSANAVRWQVWTALLCYVLLGWSPRRQAAVPGTLRLKERQPSSRTVRCVWISWTAKFNPSPVEASTAIRGFVVETSDPAHPVLIAP
nr:hypothetical protein [Verrucomicrobiota bacterium]